jgi:hypothetical protein
MPLRQRSRLCILIMTLPQSSLSPHRDSRLLMIQRHRHRLITVVPPHQAPRLVHLLLATSLRFLIVLSYDPWDLLNVG